MNFPEKKQAIILSYISQNPKKIVNSNPNFNLHSLNALVYKISILGQLNISNKEK